MKNKKGQAEIWAFLMAIIGAVGAWMMAGRMDAGMMYRIITTLLTGVVCYFLVIWIGNSG